METECLAVVVVDEGEKDKPSAKVLSADAGVQPRHKICIASGEVTGKMFETTLFTAAGTEGEAAVADRRREGEELSPRPNCARWPERRCGT